MAKSYELSQAAYERLHAEHAHLTTTWRIEIARKIEVAREMGDLSENGDYHAAKEEQGKTEARIGHLAALLENANIIEAGDGSAVQAGSIVTLTYEDDDEGDEERYLVGMIEEHHDDLDVISPTSPLGEALIGAEVGATVSFAAPSGVMKVTIQSIEG
jgi:transcription elongation factor GreA